MVIDKLEHSQRYETLHPLFKEAFTFLKTLEAENLPTEKKEINGDQLFALFFNGQGSNNVSTKLEAHKRYIDIHYVLGGKDVFAYRNTASCMEIHTPYQEKDDYMLFTDTPTFSVPLAKGDVAIVFPEDAHAPLTTPDHVQKAVIKVLL